jgi:hypothetical protein
LKSILIYHSLLKHNMCTIIPHIESASLHLAQSQLTIIETMVA